MPMYEYKCNQCQYTFEELRNMKDMDKEIQCPQCASKDTKRQISTFGVGGVMNTSSTPPCKSPACGGKCGL